MALYFENVTFSVSSVPGSRKPEDQIHFCVNMVFDNDKELESYAVAHGKVAVQQLIRADIEIKSGDKERPSGYKEYPLKPVAKGVLPKDTKLEANCTISAKGVIQPTLDDLIEESVENQRKLLAAKMAKDPKEAKALIRAQMEEMRKALGE
jgi:hypothetical protein